LSRKNNSKTSVTADMDYDYDEVKDIELTPKEFIDLIKFHNDPKGPLKYTFVEEDPITGEDIISEGETENLDVKRCTDGSLDFDDVPEATPEQKKNNGWTKNWPTVWRSHEEDLKNFKPEEREQWRMKEMEAENDRVQWFDLTGGRRVVEAKQRARIESCRHDTKNLKIWKKEAREEIALMQRLRKEHGLADNDGEEGNMGSIKQVASAVAPTAFLRYDIDEVKINIPLVGLGTWKANPGEVRKAVEVALKCGYRHVDCASIYKNEHEVGDALEHVFRTTTLVREDVFITSKVWNDMHKYEQILPAVQKSLRDLKSDYLDLYLIHWPVTDSNTRYIDPPIEVTWRAMERLVDIGAVRAIGVSNFSIKKLKHILSFCKIKPAVCQVEIHPYWRQTEIIEFCEQNKIHVTAYSPLGSPDSASVLGRTGPNLMDDAAVKQVVASDENNKNIGQVLVRWALQTRPKSSVLVKSINPERIKSNLDVFNWQLSKDSIATLSNLPTQKRMVDGSFFKLEYDLWDEKVDAKSLYGGSMPSENFVTTETYDRDGSKKSKNLHPGYVKSAATGRKKSTALSEIKSFDSSSDDDDDIEDPRKALRQLKNLSTRGQAELR
jgi:alcohol dehydrogenase (NADP+)